MSQKKADMTIIHTYHKFLTVHRILMVEGSRSGKTNALLILINHQEGNYIMDKIHLRMNDAYKNINECNPQKDQSY